MINAYFYSTHEIIRKDFQQNFEQVDADYYYDLIDGLADQDNQ